MIKQPLTMDPPAYHVMDLSQQSTHINPLLKSVTLTSACQVLCDTCVGAISLQVMSAVAAQSGYQEGVLDCFSAQVSSFVLSQDVQLFGGFGLIALRKGQRMKHFPDSLKWWGFN